MLHYQNNNISTEVDPAAMELIKAVEARQITGQQTTDIRDEGSIAGLKYESLHNTLINLDAKMSMFKLWRNIPKKPIESTNHDFNQLEQFGTNSSAAVAEGELPPENNSSYTRRTELTKYIGETRRISDVAMGVNTILGKARSGAVVRKEVEHGVLSVTKKLDGLLYKGNSKTVPFEFDGLNALHQDIRYWSSLENYQNSQSVVDMRGALLNELVIQDGAEAIVDFGLGDMANCWMYAPPSVLTGFAKQFSVDNSKFVNINNPMQSAGIAGQVIKGTHTQLGYVNFEYDIFIARNKPRFTTEGDQHPNSPVVAATPSPTISAVSDAEFSRFFGFDGDYYYAVAGKNRFGESKLLPLSNSKIAVTDAQAVNINFADFEVGSNGEGATGYVVYRSEVNPAGTIDETPLYPIFEVSKAEKEAGFDGAPVNVIRDRNRYIPNTEDAYMMQWDDTVTEFGMLGGMNKVELFQSAYIGKVFAILQYGMLMLYAPRRIVKFQNIGKKL